MNKFKPMSEKRLRELYQLHESVTSSTKCGTFYNFIKSNADYVCQMYGFVMPDCDIIKISEFIERCEERFDVNFVPHQLFLTCFLRFFGEERYIFRGRYKGIRVIVKPTEFFRCAGLCWQCRNYGYLLNKDNFEEVLMWHDLNLEYLEAEYNSTDCVYVFETKKQ